MTGSKTKVDWKTGVRGTVFVWEAIWRMLGPGIKSVLDAGCGENTWGKEGIVVTRCDNSQVYHDREGRLDGVDDVDLNGRWPYEDDSFDCVVAADVIEHLENPWHFVREATRVSRKTVIISTPNVESVMSRVMFCRTGNLWGFDENERRLSHHITPIFAWQIKKAADQAGWKLDSVSYVSLSVPVKRAGRLRIKDVAFRDNNQRWGVYRLTSP